MRYEDFEKQVIAEAEKFVAVNFEGRATYQRAERKTREAAVRAAKAMIAARPANDPTNKGRPVLVYAVRGSNQVVAETVYP